MSRKHSPNLDRPFDYTPREVAFLESLSAFRERLHNLRHGLVRAELRDINEYTSILVLHRRIKKRAYSTAEEECILDVGDEYKRDDLRFLADYINEIIDEFQWDDDSVTEPGYAGEEFDREFESIGNVCRSAFFRSGFNVYKRHQFPG